MRSSAKGAPVGRKVGEAKTEGTKDGEGDGTDVGEGVGWYVGEGVGFAVGTAVGWYVGEGVGSGDGCTEKGLGVNLLGNGGDKSTLGDSVGSGSGHIGIPVDGLGVFGALEGFEVDGLRVGGLFLVGLYVGFLLT